MKYLIVLACASTLVATAFAGDPLTIARQRARETSQAVTAGQAPPSHAAQPSGAPNASAPPNPALVAMQQNVASLANNLAVLQSEPSKKQPLINDLSAAAQGRSPTKNTMDKLASDLGTALSGKTLSLEQRTKLAQYMRAVSNGSHLTPAQQRAIFDDIPKILQAAGITAENSAKVVADFKAIATETQ